MPLEIDTDDNYEVECDGCRTMIPKGTKHVSCIESCCGGCYRHLCLECINSIHKEINND